MMAISPQNVGKQLIHRPNLQQLLNFHILLHVLAMLRQRVRTFKFANSALTLTTRDQHATVATSGKFQNIRCPLHIGYADGLRPFKGLINDMSTYLCDPDKTDPGLCCLYILFNACCCHVMFILCKQSLLLYSILPCCVID